MNNTIIPTIPLTPKDPPGISTELNVWWDYKANGWTLPEVTPQDKWTLTVHKNKSGVWVFSIPEYWVINESFCGGTEHVIDAYYKDLTGKDPVPGDSFTPTLTTYKPDTFKSVWSWAGFEPSWKESHNYLDSLTYKWVWLCPLSQVLFGEVPTGIWVNY